MRKLTLLTLTSILVVGLTPLTSANAACTSNNTSCPTSNYVTLSNCNNNGYKVLQENLNELGTCSNLNNIKLDGSCVKIANGKDCNNTASNCNNAVKGATTTSNCNNAVKGATTTGNCNNAVKGANVTSNNCNSNAAKGGKVSNKAKKSSAKCINKSSKSTKCAKTVAK